LRGPGGAVAGGPESGLCHGGSYSVEHEGLRGAGYRAGPAVAQGCAATRSRQAGDPRAWGGYQSVPVAREAEAYGLGGSYDRHRAAGGTERDAARVRIDARCGGLYSPRGSRRIALILRIHSRLTQSSGAGSASWVERTVTRPSTAVWWF